MQRNTFFKVYRYTITRAENWLSFPSTYLTSFFLPLDLRGDWNNSYFHQYDIDMLRPTLNHVSIFLSNGYKEKRWIRPIASGKLSPWTCSFLLSVEERDIPRDWNLKMHQSVKVSCFFSFLLSLFCELCGFSYVIKMDYKNGRNSESTEWKFLE